MLGEDVEDCGFGKEITDCFCCRAVAVLESCGCDENLVLPKFVGTPEGDDVKELSLDFETDADFKLLAPFKEFSLILDVLVNDGELSVELVFRTGDLDGDNEIDDGEDSADDFLCGTKLGVGSLKTSAPSSVERTSEILL